MKLNTIAPIYLEKNFALEEFVCLDGSGDVYVHPDLATNLQLLRDVITVWDPAFKFTISSGYRNEEHNQAVGGAADSQHMKGRAIDTTCLNHLPEALFAHYAAECGFRGLFTYINKQTGKVLWRHLDIRDSSYEFTHGIITVDERSSSHDVFKSVSN